MSLTKLMTTTALSLALAVPAFADGHSASADTEVEMEAGTETMTAEAEMEAEAEMDAGTALAEAEAEVEDAANDIENAASTMMAETEEAIEDGVEVVDDTMMAEAEVEAEAEGDFAFSGMTVADLIDMDVVGSEGEVVGEIDYVFMDEGDYKAVIAVGGLLGLGEDPVAMALSDFEMRNDQLILDSANEEQLEAMEEIDTDTIEPLADDYVIS